MRRRGTIACALTLLLSASVVGADTITLRRGETLSGEFVTVAEGVLLFRTRFAGQMMVPTDEVASLSTTSEVLVSLASGEEALGQFVVKGGVTHLVSPDGATRRLELAQVTAAVRNPQSETPPYEENATPLEGPMRGAWETGVHSRFGGDDYADLFAKLTLMRDTDEYQFRSSLLLERADEDVFPRLLRAEAEWRLAPDQKAYPVIGLGVERDTDKGLSLRTSLDLGVGGTLFEDGSERLEGAAGLNASIEQYDATPVWDEERGTVAYLLRHGSQERRKDFQKLNLRLMLRYKRGLFRNGAFAGGILVYPSVTRLGHIRATSESALLYSLNPRLRLKFNLLIDYDEDPAFREIDKWSTSIGASLLWDF